MFRPSSKSQTRAKNKMRKKWRLFHATNFQSLNFLCFIICRICGIFPYNINGSTFQASKWRYILSSIIVVIFCITFTEILYEINVTNNIAFRNVPEILQGNCYYLFGGFTVIITYILSGSRMRLLQTVMKVSSRLPPESYREMSKFVHAKDISMFLLIITLLILHYKFNNILDYLYYISASYIIMVQSNMDMLYINCVCVLKACFQKINDNLANLQKIAMNDEPHFLEQSQHNQKNPFLLMELKALKKQHLIVSDTVQKLNIIFSLQLLATIVMTFTQITFSLYFITEYIYDKYVSNKKSILNWYSFLHILFYSTKIAMLIWSCETGKDRAMGITTTVHDVLVSTNDKEIKNELQLFSLQLMHRDNTFSAKGVTVDATLLTAIVGSITTYLLILVQFMNAASICDKKPSGNITQNI